MKYRNDASRLTVVTVFVAYDRAETARRLKSTFDRAHAEVDGMVMFDLRLWRLDILELARCWAQALGDLADADLFTMAFNRVGEAVVSSELICLVEKWFNDGCERRSVLLASPDGTDDRNTFVGVREELAQRCGLDFSSSSDQCDQLHEFFVLPVFRKINTSSNLLN